MTPAAEVDIRPEMGSMPEMLDDATSIKTYKLVNPAAESMGELRAWVHAQPRFRVDVTDIPLRVWIKASIKE